MTVSSLLTDSLRTVFSGMSVSFDIESSFKESSNPKFGDYQSNAALVLAQKSGMKPRELAETMIKVLGDNVPGINFSMAGPGFINANLSNDFINSSLSSLFGSKKLGVDLSVKDETVVVDYSHPNLAKEMHVGHLRSTIIGDALVKILEFVGYNVVRHNHMGDWGTQFGMLIAYLEGQQEQEGQGGEKALADLEVFYRAAKQSFDSDKSFAKKAREYTVLLQNGDPYCQTLWRKFIAISIAHCDQIYKKLDVSLTKEHVYPESAYREDLPKVISSLDAKGLLTISDGAKCVFLEELRSDDGDLTPVIVQKSDGAYLYATTDLAAIRYRAGNLAAKRILYVVDSRQSLHLKQIFTVARAAKFLPENTSLEHLAFGTMMGKDGKPFKTREGDTVKLMALLTEAEKRAKVLVAEKAKHLDSSSLDMVAHAIGIGAVKYADLSKSRINDYKFDIEAMLSFEGNTAPYLQYAYTRIISIFSKENIDLSQANIQREYQLYHEEERKIAMTMLHFPEVLVSVTRTGLPHVLCNYLYNLAKAYMSFYEQCPVLISEHNVKNARLGLCSGVAVILRTGLGLLGINVVNKM